MNDDIEERGERLRAAAGQLRGGVSAKLGDLSGAILFKAIVIAVLGVCLIFWPTKSISILLLAVGVMLIIDGIVELLGAIRAQERGAFLGQSILSLAIGAALLFWPGASVRTLFLVLGAWSLLHGISLLWSLREIDQDDDSYRPAQRTVGIVLTVIGAVLILWPGAGVVTLSWVLGIAALVIAGVLFWLSQRMKRLKNRVAEGPA